MVKTRKRSQHMSFLWQMATLIILISLALAIVGCGGDDDEKTTSSATPQPTTPPVTTTTSSTPAEDPNDVAVAMKDRMADLVVLFAQVDGQWQGYVGANSETLGSLEQGKTYWFYTTEDLTPPWSIALYEGWSNAVWLGDSAASATALSGYEDTILFVVMYDIQADQRYLYQSPVVTELTQLQPGQTYQVFEQPSGSPFGQTLTYTH